MKARFIEFVGRAALVAAVAALPSALRAAVGDVWASSSASPAFSLYTTDGTTYSAVSAAEIAALPPVVWLEGDTVTETSPAGVVTVLAANASTTGSVSLASSLVAGGIYEFVDSVWGSAKVCIPYTVYGEVGNTIASTASALSGYRVDSRQPGPNRRTSVNDALPIAYSGDDWGGDAAKAATMTITPSSGEATVLALEGTGVTPFRFGVGAYTVTLAADGYATRTAEINVTGGFIITFR